MRGGGAWCCTNFCCAKLCYAVLRLYLSCISAPLVRMGLVHVYPTPVRSAGSYPPSDHFQHLRKASSLPLSLPRPTYSSMVQYGEFSAAGLLQNTYTWTLDKEDSMDLALKFYATTSLHITAASPFHTAPRHTTLLFPHQTHHATPHQTNQPLPRHPPPCPRFGASAILTNNVPKLLGMHSSRQPE